MTDQSNKNTQASDLKSEKSTSRHSKWDDIEIDEKSVHEFFESIDLDALFWNIDHMHGKDPNIIYDDDLASLTSNLKSGKINTDGMHISDSNSGRIIKEDMQDSDNKSEKLIACKDANI